MRVLCAWCKRTLRYAVGAPGQVSHGICRKCELQQYERDGIITPEEQAELNRLRKKVVTA